MASDGTSGVVKLPPVVFSSDRNLRLRYDLLRVISGLWELPPGHSFRVCVVSDSESDSESIPDLTTIALSLPPKTVSKRRRRGNNSRKKKTSAERTVQVTSNVTPVEKVTVPQKPLIRLALSEQIRPSAKPDQRSVSPFPFDCFSHVNLRKYYGNDWTLLTWREKLERSRGIKDRKGNSLFKYLLDNYCGNLRGKVVE